ncbi:hypothetical protein NBRC116585_00160 [Thalassolituus maritimus]|uniref:DUF983 domain-containing protein n=1 Tax=Thalassolituus maritimus TaxID=484498 RepID=A0ABP9ZUU1_9GAMM
MYMKPKLKCPDCGADTVSKLEKLKIAAFGSKVQCKGCGAQLTVGGQWIGLILGAALGSSLFAILAYSASTKSWWPLVAALSVVFVTPTLVYYFIALRRVGSKRFNLE